MSEWDERVHRALSAKSRVGLLRTLSASAEPLGAQALADETGLHLTTVRAHLDVLVEAGLVSAQPESRNAPGRPRLLYRATPGGAPATGADYRLLAEVLTSYLAGTASEPATQALAAGKAWGHYLTAGPPPYVELAPAEACARVVELFATLGFEPELAEDGHQLLLRRCPFLDLAQRHPDVVCSLHLGLLQGALERLGATVTAERLEPFVEPSMCVAHLDGAPAPA